MPAPNTPDDFKALIPNPGAGACDEFNKVLLQFPLLFYKWYKYFYNADGTISDAASQDICDGLKRIGCAGGSTGSSGSTGHSSASSGSSGSTASTPAAEAKVWAVTGPPSGSGTSPNKFMEVNLANGSVNVIKTGTSFFYGLAEDPTSGILYGLVLNGSDIDFVSVNKVTGDETVIAASVTPGGQVNGLTFDASGVLYCEIGSTPTSCATNGTLKTIDLGTGAFTTVGGHTGVFLSDICFKGSVLYGVGQAGCFTDKRIFTVNTSTGAATVVASLNPAESEPDPFDSLAYVNGKLYKTDVNKISQVNTGTGAVHHVADFDNAINGRIRGMAKNQ